MEENLIISIQHRAVGAVGNHRDAAGEHEIGAADAAHGAAVDKHLALEVEMRHAVKIGFHIASDRDGTADIIAQIDPLRTTVIIRQAVDIHHRIAVCQQILGKHLMLHLRVVGRHRAAGTVAIDHHARGCTVLGVRIGQHNHPVIVKKLLAVLQSVRDRIGVGKITVYRDGKTSDLHSCGSFLYRFQAARVSRFAAHCVFSQQICRTWRHMESAVCCTVFSIARRSRTVKITYGANVTLQIGT